MWRKQAWQQLLMNWQRQEGKIAKVIAENEEALAKNPQDMIVLERLGDLYGYGQRDPAKAVAVYEKLVAVKPADVTYINRLASVYQETKQFDKAVAVFHKMIEANPAAAGPGPHSQIAQLLLMAGKKEEAVAYAKEHLPNDPSDTGTPSMLESFLNQAGLPAEAEEAIKKQLAAAKTPAAKGDCMLRIADLSRQHKDYAKAEEQIRQVYDHLRRR